jgi:hypothetical protein
MGSRCRQAMDAQTDGFSIDSSVANAGTTTHFSGGETVSRR